MSVNSVYFPKKGTGYVYKKAENPGPKPNKSERKYYKHDWNTHKEVFNQKRYDNDYETWEKDKKYYDENKGEFTNPCSVNLIGKKFEFKPGKVNIIFGPNGSGKTTILRAIAGEAGIDGDGFTKAETPTNAFGIMGDKTINDFKKRIEGLKKNTAKVDWDGNIIYYNNFTHTSEYGIIELGMLQGTALTSLEEEVQYRFAGKTSSSGQKAGWLLSKVIRFNESGMTLKSIFEPHLDKKKYNECWYDSYRTQAEYFEKYENYDKVVPMTFLFDEPEVNFDIATVWTLYSKLFPEICQKSGAQIITVSHSPLVLSEDIANNDMVNIVSIDENYTKEMKSFLKTIKF